MKAFLVTIALAMGLSGCMGYRIGEVKPGYLRSVQSIAIPTFHNDTILPRIEVLFTDTVIKQFQQDGTFRITTEDKADAVLRCTIVAINRAPARSVRGNVLATTEFNLNASVGWTLFGRDGKLIAGPGNASGSTNFFVGSDVTADERQALPLAAEELATRLVSSLSEGW